MIKMDPKEYQKIINRRNIKRQEAIKNKMERDKVKRESTLISAISRLKEVSRKDTWCTDHANCFRGTITIDGKGESEAHLDKKYELWKECRKMGGKVFTELRLAEGGRPDLVVCWNNGKIEIIEVVESEREESLLLKEDKYPFPMRVVKA